MDDEWLQLPEGYKRGEVIFSFDDGKTWVRHDGLSVKFRPGAGHATVTHVDRSRGLIEVGAARMPRKRK